ncbi:MAG TPA: HAMP domain-containing sensor histidine kinase [Myxococcales bacterium]|nr:HAMP domain-containing sensor histidine kinase [Myxococcales bacterium]
MGAAFLSLLGVAASAALYLTARAMEENGSFLGDAVEAIGEAEQVHDTLQRARQSDVPPEAYREAEAQAVRDAQHDLDTFSSKKYISGQEEQDLFDGMRQDLADYLKAAGPAADAARNDALNDAQAKARQLVKLNTDQANERRQRNAKVDKLGRAVAVCLAGALVIGSLLFLFVLQVAVDRPLAGLREALARFKGGAREERLPVEGPEELRQIATEFNEMADSEARRDRLQLEFLAGVAHDLRGPLNILKLSAQSIAGAPTLPPADRIRGSLNRVSAQVDRLARMVDDLLDRTRIEAGNVEMQMEVCDLRPLVEEVVDLYRAVSDQHHLEISVPERPVPVRGDPTRLMQVLTNLVSNAIKYSPDGGAVKLELEEAGGEAVISVVDEGVGIPLEDHERIFEPFHRARSGESGQIPGVGLGLSVSRRLVLAHGGRIEVEARQERGSVFRVRLPVAQAAAPSADGPRPSPHH